MLIICAVECRLSDSAQATQLQQSHELKWHIKNSGQVSFFSQMEFPDERKLLANVREALTPISIQPTRLIAMNHFIAVNTWERAHRPNCANDQYTLTAS